MKNKLLFLILNLSFITSLLFGASSNTPSVSISPTFVSILEGTASVNLTVTLSPAPNKNEMVVAYSDQCNVAGSAITIAQDTSVGTITIPTSGLAAHTSCNIVLTSATGGPAQNNGIITISTATITVTAVSDPTANDKSYTAFYETDLTGNVITDTPADSDPNNLALSISSHTTPSNGSLTLSTDGSFTYSPNANYSGMDSFNYTIDNGNGGIATATVTIEVLEPQADLGIIKSGPTTVLSGASISYSLAVSNSNATGMTTATDVKVVDNLPSGMIYDGYNAAGWTCTHTTGTVTCTNPSVAVGYTGTITINTTAPSANGDITNTATISSSIQDNNAANDSSSLLTAVADSATDLSISKTADKDPVITASPLIYTINVSNIGSNDASGINVKDILAADLQFVSVVSPDWSCSQGQVVTCDYTANGGVLTSGASTGDITITVTTPPQATSVFNEANVTSTTSDTDLTNNTSNVTVTVNDGTNVGSDVPLTKYLQYNLFGDMKLIGNANVNYSGTDPGKDYNDNVDMRYVDTDGDSSTFNSSSSTLVLADPSYEIVWAGLYWEGHICSTDNNPGPGNNNDGSGDGSGGGCDWSNSPYDSFNSGKDHLGKIKLKTPNRVGYIDITANSLNIIERSTYNWTYSAFADITHLIDSDETGTYRVADIILTEGQIGSGGNYGGWSIQTIYKDPANALHYKNISVFNGFQYIQSDNNQVDIDGFITPLSGPVTASIAFFSADGDPVVGGVGQMRVGNSTTYNPIGGDAANPTDNLFNSTIADFGVPINTGITKTYGVDADRVDVSSFMTNDQHDTSFLFDVSTPSGGVDHYSITMFSFATDLTTPIINNFQKRAVIIDTNGTTRTARPGEPIYPGNELVYTLTFTNTGDEVAELVEIFDDFDFDGLTPALDLDNFDASKIGLYNGTDTTSPVINPDCGYDAGDHRVYCNLDSVAIDATYNMVFSVTVKDPLDLNILLDANATNTAYAIYKNPNGDSYVILESDGNGDFGGKSNTFNAGIFVNPGSSGETGTIITVDAINRNYSYHVDKNITTKVVNEPFDIKLVHVDLQGNNTGYQAWEGDRPMPVIVTLCTGTDNEELLADPTVTQFYHGDSEIIATNINLTKAHRDDKIKMGYIDWNIALTWPDSTSPCVNNSNDSANLNGVPQCFNAWVHASDVFPEDDYPHVRDVCYDVDDQRPSGTKAPCDSNAYHNDTPDNIYPTIYNNSYGCYHCLTDAFSEFNRCSTDNFAARPDHFELDSTNTSYPDLLRSGLDYNLSLFALDGSYDPTHHTTEYNQYSHSLDINQTLYFSDGSIDTSTPPELDGNLTFSSSDYNITDGESISPSTGSNEVVGINFSDIATVGISIVDPHWSEVDYDDTPQDCNSSEVEINGNTISIEGPAYICGDINTTFIPHHFTVRNIHLNNHAQTPRLTYLSNDLNMSAHVDVTISAMNANNVDITKNFRQDSGFYENPVSVVLRVTDWNTSLPVSRHPLGNTVIIKDIPTAQNLGFGGTDTNGTHTIDWDENNATQKIMFNYVRAINQVVNPFDINGTDLNITVTSTYTGTAPEGTAIIEGDGIGDQNATFYYARTRSSKFFYEDVTTTTVNTPIAIDIYCNLGFTACTNLGIDTVNGAINEPGWWLSLNHNMSRNDGNVTLVKGSILEGPAGSGWTIAPTDVNISINGVDNNIVVSNTSGVTPLTVAIELDNTTSSWVIYNESHAILAPSPFYKVRFIGESSWTGEGTTGYAVDTNASYKKSNKMNW